MIAAGAAGLGVLALPGCGGSDGSAKELVFWNGFTGGDGPTMVEILDGYTKQSGVAVKMVSVRWLDYYQKVPAAVQAGRGPDLGIMHVDQLPVNAAHGVLRPLDDVAQALGFKEADFAPAVWNAGVYQGRRYGIPLDLHPLGLYLNEAVFEEAGLDPEPPADREAFESVLEQLKGKGVQGNWVSPFLFTGGLMFQSLLWQFGGDLTDREATRATWNSDAGVEAISYLKGLVDKGFSPPGIAQDADNVAFKSAKNAMIWNGAWGVADYGATEGLKWRVAPLPRIGDRRAAWSNSHNFVVMRGIADAKLPAVRGLIDAVTQSPKWSTAGMVPARDATRETAEFRKSPAAPLAREVPYVRFPAPLPGIADVRETTLDVAVQQALTGAASPRKALDDAAGRATRLLRINREKFLA
jgi:multiple sugar transport system substrate-binding protein